MHKGLVARALAGVVTSIALIGGPGLVAVAQADTVSAAQHCRQERQDVRHAQVAVKKAKKAKKKAVKAGKKKAVAKANKKLTRAKRNLRTQKAQMAHWCNKAKSEAATTTKGQETKAGYDEVLTGPAASVLPPSLKAALDTAVASAQSAVDQLLAQVPGASPATLAQITDQLDALDPTALQMAIEDLAAQLQSAGGNPAALAALVEGLLGNVAPGTTIPTTGGLGDLQGTLEGLVAALSTFDPSTGAAGLAGLESAVDALTGQLSAAAPQLTTLFGTLAGLNGGSVPSDPTALLVLLQGAITGLVGGPGTSTTITTVLGGLLGGLGGGLGGLGL